MGSREKRCVTVSKARLKSLPRSFASLPMTSSHSDSWENLSFKRQQLIRYWYELYLHPLKWQYESWMDHNDKRKGWICPYPDDYFEKGKGREYPVYAEGCVMTEHGALPKWIRDLHPSWQGYVQSERWWHPSHTPERLKAFYYGEYAKIVAPLRDKLRSLERTRYKDLDSLDCSCSISGYNWSKKKSSGLSKKKCSGFDEKYVCPECSRTSSKKLPSLPSTSVLGGTTLSVEQRPSGRSNSFLTRF